MKRSIFLFLLIVFSLFEAKGQSDSAHTEFWSQYRGLVSPKLSTGVLADVGELVSLIQA